VTSVCDPNPVIVEIILSVKLSKILFKWCIVGLGVLPQKAEKMFLKIITK